MKRCRVVFLVAQIMVAGLCAAQATPATARAEIVTNELRTLLEPVGVFVDAASLAPSSRQGRALHLQWQQPSSPRGGNEARRLSVVSHAAAGTLPRQRSLELTAGTLLVAALDASGRLRWWQTITDPRFLRSEAPGPDGVLTGITIANPSPGFRVVVPNDPDIVELRLYQPQQNADGNVSLAVVDSVRLP